MDKQRLIAIEGPIGVGKTTFAKRLARRLEASLVLESTDNPFLESFYKDRRGAAFSAQIWFLLARHQQLQPLRQGNLFHRTVVCDYLFEKDRVFAYLNLNDSELATYEKLFQLLAADIVRPDLVVYLQAKVPSLTRRITERGRDIERRISQQYLNETVQACDHFFFRYTDAPLLVVDTTEIDPAHEDADFEDLVRRIGAMDRGGVEYYKPRAL
jgi:deoxyadenosine/deoxycytidine kinase